VLEPYQGDPDPEVRMTVQAILKKVKTQKQAPQQTLSVSDTNMMKLLAIRVLEERKAKEALPVLKRLQSSEKVLLAHAAKTATWRIKGESANLVTVADLLTTFEKRLPRDPGFLGIAQLIEGREDYTLEQLLKRCFKSVAEKPELQSMLSQKDMLMAQANKGIQQALMVCGNIRIDGAALLIPKKMGMNDQESYFALIIRGLYDRDRVLEFVKASSAHRHGRGAKLKTYHGAEVFENHSASVCFLDNKTMIFVTSPDNGAQIESVIKAWKKPSNAEFTQPAKRVFETFRKKKPRVLIGGKLTDQQKQKVRQETQEGLNRLQNRKAHNNSPMMIAFGDLRIKTMTCMQRVAEADRYMLIDGNEASNLEMTFPNMEKAKTAKKALLDMNVAIKKVTDASAGRGGANPIAALIDSNKPLISVSLDKNKLVIKGAQDSVSILTLLPMMTFGVGF
jgi:hypothetical protein